MSEFRANHQQTRALETTEVKRAKYIHCQASLWGQGLSGGLSRAEAMHPEARMDSGFALRDKSQQIHDLKFKKEK